MNSLKVLSFLLVVGLSQSAPQISQQGVVGQVLGQLQPAIARTLAQILSGRSTNTVGLGQGVAGAVRSTSAGFGQGATGAIRSTSFVQGVKNAVRTENVGSPRVSSSSSQSALSASELTSSVVASLQPSIAAAVAQALTSSSAANTRQTLTSSVTSTDAALSPGEEAELNAKLSANAQYEYGYKVADDDAQAYMAHQEVRNGLNVEGTYNYVDANGALVTVTYQAGPEGYTENREVEDGAVQMRTTYGAWDGPFADTVPAGVSSTVADVAQTATISTRGSSSSAVSQSDLIAQILSAVQPEISTAVQRALTSSTRSSTVGASSGSTVNSAQTNSVVASQQSSSAVASQQSSSAVASQQSSSAVGQSQSTLISNIIRSLQPQISSVVQDALYTSTPVVVVQPAPVRRLVRPVPVKIVAPAAVSSGLTSIFGVAGENNVRIETPDFTIGY